MKDHEVVSPSRVDKRGEREEEKGPGEREANDITEGNMSHVHRGRGEEGVGCVDPGQMGSYIVHKPSGKRRNELGSLCSRGSCWCCGSGGGGIESDIYIPLPRQLDLSRGCHSIGGVEGGGRRKRALGCRPRK